MANPKKGTIQLENGYTKIANDLIEKLAKVKMSGQSWQVLFAIIRKLYGHNKKTDWIEYSQLMEITNLPKSRVCEAVKVLRENGIVTQERNGIRQIISICKDFYIVTEKRNRYGFQKNRYVKPVSTVTVSSTTKETETKENIQKKTNTLPSVEKVKPERPQTEDVLRNKAIGEIIDAFKKTVNPEIEFGHKGHRNAAGRLVDAQGAEQAIAIARYVTSSAYVEDQYSPTATDPSALERNLPRIRVYALKKKSAKGGIAIIS